MNQLTSRWCS